MKTIQAFLEGPKYYTSALLNRSGLRILLSSIFFISSFNLFAEIDISFSLNPRNGECNGLIFVTAVGDASPFEVELTLDSEVIESYSNINQAVHFQDLCAGKYSVVVIDSYGCKKVLTRTLFSCEKLLLNTGCVSRDFPTDCLSNDGSIQISPECIMNAELPIKVKWSNGLVSNTINNALSD